MVAKPVIDIAIVVEDGVMPEAISSIETAGYAYHGDLGLRGREAFVQITSVTRELPSHHLYAFEASAFELRKQVSFRDYLIAHPDEALRLAAFKRYLAFELKVSRSDYITGKAALVEEMASAALAWYSRRTAG